MRLSKRLELVASFVPKGSRVADVGCDHGYIPIELVGRGICPEGIAMDVGKGPLKRAGSHIQARGLSGKISTRLSDGLSALMPGEADSAVIAGMGGELVIHILESGRHLWDSMGQFILSPQSELEKVRYYLEENGFRIEKEDMVLDEGKYYTVMLVKRGTMNYGKLHWYRYGKELIAQKNKVLSSFLEKEEERMGAILKPLQLQQTPGAKAAAEEIEKQLACLNQARKEMEDEMQ